MMAVWFAEGPSVSTLLMLGGLPSPLHPGRFLAGGQFSKQARRCRRMDSRHPTLSNYLTFSIRVTRRVVAAASRRASMVNSMIAAAARRSRDLRALADTLGHHQFAGRTLLASISLAHAPASILTVRPMLLTISAAGRPFSLSRCRSRSGC